MTTKGSCKSLCEPAPPLLRCDDSNHLGFLKQDPLPKHDSKGGKSRNAARPVFDPELLPTSVVSWTSLIAAYSRSGESSSLESFRLYHKMLCSDMVPDKVTFIVMLKAASSLLALDAGRNLHQQAVESSLETDEFVANSLIGMYMKSGNVAEGKQLFQKMHDGLVDNVVSWTSLIAGCVAGNLWEEAISLFQEMMVKGTLPNEITFISIFKACGCMLSVEKGQRIHLHVLHRGNLGYLQIGNRLDVENNLSVGNAVVDMYAKCGAIQCAHQAFSLMQVRDVVSWTSMISGFANQGLPEEALFVFNQMQQQHCVECDSVVYATAIQVCTNLMSSEEGKRIHVYVVNMNSAPDALLLSNLVGMYTECENLILAWRVFDEIKESKLSTEMWNNMIARCASHGHCNIAQKLFKDMQERCFLPDWITALSMLRICSDTALLKQLYVQVSGAGHMNICLQNALVNKYISSGFLDQARELFKEIQNWDIVTWNTMICGYAWHELFHEAITTFEEMQREGVQPDCITFSSILKVCAAMALLEYGMRVHNLIAQYSLGMDIYVKSALIDMYMKSGAMEEASFTFNNMAGQNIVSWNIMIAGYAQQGLPMVTFTLFDSMQNDVMPDLITFIELLYACNHSGLVSEVHHVFKLMCSSFGLTPTTDHYACVVDIMGRAGSLEEAVDKIRHMPIQPDAEVWMSVLSACRNNQCNADLDAHAFEHVVEIQFGNTSKMNEVEQLLGIHVTDLQK